MRYDSNKFQVILYGYFISNISVFITGLVHAMRSNGHKPKLAMGWNVLMLEHALCKYSRFVRLGKRKRKYSRFARYRKRKQMITNMYMVTWCSWVCQTPTISVKSNHLSCIIQHLKFLKCHSGLYRYCVACAYVLFARFTKKA